MVTSHQAKTSNSPHRIDALPPQIPRLPLAIPVTDSTLPVRRHCGLRRRKSADPFPLPWLAPTTGTNGARATESERQAIHPSLYIHPSESSCVLVLLTIHASLALDESCELLSSVVSSLKTPQP